MKKAILIAVAALTSIGAAAQTLTIPLTVDGVSKQYQIDMNTVIMISQALAMTKPTAIQIMPGGSLGGPDGNAWSVHPDNKVYRNGLPFGTNLVAKLVLIGPNVFAVGKTDAKLWRLTGAGPGGVPAWTQITAYDTQLITITDPPPAPTASRSSASVLSMLRR